MNNNNKPPRSARQRAARQARKAPQDVSSEPEEGVDIWTTLAGYNQQLNNIVATQKRQEAILMAAARNPLVYKAAWDWYFGEPPKSKL
jgi:hypothetical protein